MATVRDRGIYCHAVPGRMRLKLPGLKGAPRRAERLARMMRELPGVTESVANPTTGSLLVLFDRARTDAATLIAFLKERGEIGREVALPVSPTSAGGSRGAHPLATIAWSAGSAIGREILKGALNRALKDTPWSLLLAVV